MQADWEVEIGGNAPVIDACWPGFVDLRLFPNRLAELVETQELPALADALVHLNARQSPVWTAKCDVWAMSEVDRFELDAPPEGAVHGIACYVDLLPSSGQQWTFPQMAVEWCKLLCGQLQSVPLHCCRVDLIIRRASITPPAANDLGITAYLSVCGPTEGAAARQLGAALAAFADTVSPEAPPAPNHSQLK